MSYKIITRNSITDLVLIVNQELEQGYKPIGGFQVVNNQVAQTLFADSITVNKEDETLFNKLKNKRKELSDKIAAPAYIVATNRMLESLVQIKPKNKDQLRNVYGFSEQKINLYGDIFLQIINE